MSLSTLPCSRVFFYYTQSGSLFLYINSKPAVATRSQEHNSPSCICKQPDCSSPTISRQLKTVARSSSLLSHIPSGFHSAQKLHYCHSYITLQREQSTFASYIVNSLPAITTLYYNGNGRPAFFSLSPPPTFIYRFTFKDRSYD